MGKRRDLDLRISLKWRPIGVSMRFRPLSTRALRALELRALNRADASWSPFNYYIDPVTNGDFLLFFARDPNHLDTRCLNLVDPCSITIVAP